MNRRLMDAWHDFYVLIGTAAATLMGLTFVAVSLAPDVIAERTTTAVRAFITPILAFFATILIISLFQIIPGMPSIGSAAFFIIAGIGGLAYIATTGVHRLWRTMELGIDDWIWYIGLPLLGYACILAGGAALWLAREWGIYAAAGATLVLLIAGIRNAWDILLTIAHQKAA